MTDYTYGPWTVHTPGKCPVPPDTLVQMQFRSESQIDAEESAVVVAGKQDWSADGEIAYYRIAQVAEWWVETGCFGIGSTMTARTKAVADQFRVHWPVIDGQPDFTRQPKWEKI